MPEQSTPDLLAAVGRRTSGTRPSVMVHLLSRTNCTSKGNVALTQLGRDRWRLVVVAFAMTAGHSERGRSAGALIYTNPSPFHGIATILEDPIHCTLTMQQPHLSTSILVHVACIQNSTLHTITRTRTRIKRSKVPFSANHARTVYATERTKHPLWPLSQEITITFVFLHVLFSTIYVQTRTPYGRPD